MVYEQWIEDFRIFSAVFQLFPIYYTLVVAEALPGENTTGELILLTYWFTKKEEQNE